MSELWNAIESNLPLITAMGVVATAVIALLQYRSTKRYNRPEVLVGQYFPNKDKERPHKIAYQVESGSSKWLIQGVRIRRRLRRHLAKAEGVEMDDFGNFDGGGPGPWCRHIRFDPPVRNSNVLIHRDAPKAFLLRIDLCMSSDPKTKSRVVRRMVVGN